jgi:LytS/YehU family sensor histidine kinase
VIVAAIIGCIAGIQVRQEIGPVHTPRSGLRPPVELNAAHRIAYQLALTIVCGLVGGLATFVLVSRRTALAARARQQEAERARALARRRTLESELQALQARVEPMFLFDTLERIRATYRSDAAAGSAMMEYLILYLRAALPHLRESTSTVAQEFRLVGAWLDIVGRGATQWTVDLDAGDSAREARLPALVLLPLVQCAVAGAATAPMSLRLRVQADAGRLSIDLSTSSDVFSRGIAGEPRLQQIDDRLRALYGKEASFACGDASVGPGSQARMELPLDLGVPDAKATS